MTQMSKDENSLDLITKVAQAGHAEFKAIGVQTLNTVTDFTTFFAEWLRQGDNLVLHVFPRAGEDDTWFEGDYVGEGRNSKYIPARREQKPDGLDFPPHMPDLLRAAAHHVWMGDVQMDFVEELGAYALRFMNIQDVPKLEGEGGFIDKFLSEIDRSLDN